MAKRRQGTIQQILDRNYATARARANRIDGRSTPEAKARAAAQMKATMSAYWQTHGRKAQFEPDSEDTPKLHKRLKKKHKAQMRSPIWLAENKRGPIFSLYADRASARERQKIDIARWQAECPE